MRSKRLAVTPPMLAQFPALYAPLAGRGVEVVFNPGAYPLDEQSLISFLQNSQTAIIGLERVTPHVISSCPALCLIARNGVGLDNVDLNAANRAGLLVTATFGSNSTSVAELTMGLMLALARSLVPHHNTLQTGVWKREQGVELAGKTLGIIGLGRIGKKVATRALGFEMHVIANDILPDHEFAARHRIPFVTLDALLAQSDLISLHVPLTPLTHHMINSTTLSQVKPGAFLLNTARGPVVDPTAVAAALDTGRLGGAGLDVHTVDGEADRAMLGRCNVITTPHIGAFTGEALWNTTEYAIKSIVEFLDDREPSGLVNPEAWGNRRTLED